MAKGSKPPKGPEKKQDDFQHKFFRKYPTAQAGLPTTTSTETDIEQEPVRKTVKRFGGKLLDATYHLGVTIVYLGGIAIAHWFLKKWLGEDAKFFHSVPISWIIDTGHILVILKFFWEIIRDFRGPVE